MPEIPPLTRNDQPADQGAADQLRALALSTTRTPDTAQLDLTIPPPAQHHMPLAVTALLARRSTHCA